MLHDRILLLVKYVSDVIAGASSQSNTAACPQHVSILGSAVKDHATLRSLSALIASLPASENKNFRKEFDTVCSLTSQGCEAGYLHRGYRQEYEDVQLTAYLSALTKSTSILNDVRFSHSTLLQVVDCPSIACRPPRRPHRQPRRSRLHGRGPATRPRPLRPWWHGIHGRAYEYAKWHERLAVRRDTSISVRYELATPTFNAASITLLCLIVMCTLSTVSLLCVGVDCLID